jgi:hypothetical protein
MGNGTWASPVTQPIVQLFAEGAIVWEAQWPNRTPDVLFQVPGAVAGAGTGVSSSAGDGGMTSLLVDPNLPDADWTGARVFIVPGYEWQSDSRPVSGYDPVAHALSLDTTIPWASPYTRPRPTNRYFLYGSPAALDAQDEWTVVASSDGSGPYTLLYESTDDPSTHVLEAKARAYAFDVAQSFVQIVGFRTFGSAVRLTGNGNVVDSLNIEYPTHLRDFDAFASLGDVCQIVGDDNVWKNSLIEKSGSAGLVVQGNRNLIVNNVAQDIDYQATNRAAFEIVGGPFEGDNTYQGNVFAYNTVRRTGRAGIIVSGAASGRVVFNSLSDWSLLTTDMGAIYAQQTDGAGTEIAFNELAGSTAFWSNGILFDDGAKHFLVHHNFVHDSTYWAFETRAANAFYDNTVVASGAPFLVDKNYTTGAWDDTSEGVMENNVADGVLLLRAGFVAGESTDGGAFEAPVPVTTEWQHVNLSFSSMRQAPWVQHVPFDVSAVQALTFAPLTNGEFEVDLANIRLEGAAPLVLDDFTTTANALGGAPWAGGSGDGATGSIASLAMGSGGPSGHDRIAMMTGTAVDGFGSWALFQESLPRSNLSTYSGVSFDVRGHMNDFRVPASGGSPVQSNNAICEEADAALASCARGAGVVVPGVNPGTTGQAPDLGAFTSTSLPWSPGAQRASDDALCGKLADLDASLPPQAPGPWSAAAPEASDTEAAPLASSTSCACRAGQSRPSGAARFAIPLFLAFARRASRRAAARRLRPVASRERVGTRPSWQKSGPAVEKANGPAACPRGGRR